MPDEGIQCVLGRLEEKVNTIETTIKEIKEEQKTISFFINEQKTLVKYTWIIAIIISGALTFSNTIISFLSGVFSTKEHIGL